MNEFFHPVTRKRADEIAGVVYDYPVSGLLFAVGIVPYIIIDKFFLLW
ncbi:MAG: hypothetical protein J6A61_05640 [Clostridia bacterium]|nr:hypothetical protein [Clostridia bacterium]